MVLLHPELRADDGLVVRDLSGSGLEPLSVDVPSGAEHTPVSLFGNTPFLAAVAVGRGARVVQQGGRRAGPARARRRPVTTPRQPGAHQDRRADGLRRRLPAAPGHRGVARPTSTPRSPPARWPTRARCRWCASAPTSWSPAPSPGPTTAGRRLRIGEGVYRAVKGCARCAIPTTDHETAERFKEPTATLARTRRWDGQVWFGTNLVCDTPGVTIRVGDEVEVLETRDGSDGPPRELAAAGQADRRQSVRSPSAVSIARWKVG